MGHVQRAILAARQREHIAEQQWLDRAAQAAATEPPGLEDFVARWQDEVRRQNAERPGDAERLIGR